MNVFPVSVPIHVRWRDVDALRHVNNAVYFTYFEIARTKYYEEVFGAKGVEDIDFILASIRCDFIEPILYGTSVEVRIGIPVVGSSSFDFSYEICRTAENRVVSRASSTQVLFDYGTNQKRSITPTWLEQVEAAQGDRPPHRSTLV